MEILLFGNPSMELDNLAIKVGVELEREGRSVRHLVDPLELLDVNLAESLILDVAVGIDDVKLIDNVDRLVLGRLCSLHDFDMAYFLKLLKQMGKLDAVRIVALPQSMSLEEALEKVRKTLRRITAA